MDGGSTEATGDGPTTVLGGLEGWWAHTRIAIWSLVLFGSVLLNATLLVAFIRRPGLRTISNRFVMNLIASNLLAIFVLTSLVITDACGTAATLPDSWTSSFCAFSEGAVALVTTSSILSVLVIGVDQYLAVVDPLRYRTRIDKLKCALLILAVWLIACSFGALASLNPQARTLWRNCVSRDLDEEMDKRVKMQESFELNVNNTTVENGFSFQKNLTAQVSAEKAGGYRLTYGLVYAIIYAVLGYLVPFLAMCWIYVSIYMAARNNSERTRRNGSRPMLSSGSFSEEGKLDCSVEDFRRLPKISSLSSIDENSEASPSQVDVPVPAESVVFTIGSPNENAKDECKVPTTTLKANFLSADSKDDDEAGAKSKFPEVVEQRRKSSHDLMYEEMMLKHPYEYDVFSEEEDEEEEALPLSSAEKTHSISVNFDLGETEDSKMLSQTNDTPIISNSNKFNSNNTSLPGQPPIVTITPPGQKPTLHRVPSVKSTHSYINNLKYRISNGSLFKYREETRAARISALVIVMGLICWTPYVYVLLHRNLIPLVEKSGEIPSLDTTALHFLVLATYVSPLLFGYRSKRVKRELRKFFCFKRELSYRNNRSLMAKKVLKRRHSGGTILGQLAGESAQFEHSKYNIFNCVYGRNRWPKEKVQFVQVPDTALAVETCRSSFSSGASTQISSTSTDD